MKFVIVGYGRVGMRTAKILTSEGHDVVIVDNDPEKAAAAREADVEASESDGEDERVRGAAGIANADALAALSGDLNGDFTACMIAKGYDCRTVLRIDEDYRQEIYEKYAADVDEVIYPERMGAAGAKTALLGGNLNVLAELTETLTATTFDIPDGSPVVGRRVVEVDLPGGARLYAHGRRKEPMTIPMPRTEVQAGDRVALIAERSVLDEVETVLKG
jgi:trk system potassium uptake protein TrkA